MKKNYISVAKRSENIQITELKKIKKIFNKYEVGYSDHSDNELGILGSIVLGAKIVEKHIATKFNVPNTQDWKVSYNLKILYERHYSWPIHSNGC